MQSRQVQAQACNSAVLANGASISVTPAAAAPGAMPQAGLLCCAGNLGGKYKNQIDPIGNKFLENLFFCSRVKVRFLHII